MSESPSLRVALSIISDHLGNPKKVLLSNGLLLAEFEGCSQARVDQKLDFMDAQVDQRIEIPHQDGLMAIRMGQMNNVMFHIQTEEKTGLGALRLFYRPDDQELTDMWVVSQHLADVAFDATGDREQALLSYISKKMMADPEYGKKLASDLSRIVADFLRSPAVMSNTRSNRTN